MRRLWPDPTEVDDVDALVAAEPRPAPVGRPWLLVNMVASLDGAITVEGRCGQLGGPADRAVFFALRAVADVVLAGAGTVRAEGYGPARPTERPAGGAAGPRAGRGAHDRGGDPLARPRPRRSALFTGRRTRGRS